MENGEIFEIFKNSENEKLVQIGEKIFSQILEIFWKKFGINLNKTENLQKSFRKFFENKSENFFCGISVAAIKPKNENEFSREIEIFLDNGEFLEIEIFYSKNEENNFEISSADFVRIKTGDLLFSKTKFNNEIRISSPKKSALQKMPEIGNFADNFLFKIHETEMKPVDPFEIIYRKFSESEIIKKFLGEKTFVDPAKKMVIRITDEIGRTISGEKFDFDEILKEAIQKFQNEIWDSVNFSEIPKKLKKATAEK